MVPGPATSASPGNLEMQIRRPPRSAEWELLGMRPSTLCSIIWSQLSFLLNFYFFSLQLPFPSCAHWLLTVLLNFGQSVSLWGVVPRHRPQGLTPGKMLSKGTLGWQVVQPRGSHVAQDHTDLGLGLHLLPLKKKSFGSLIANKLLLLPNAPSAEA